MSANSHAAVMHCTAKQMLCMTLCRYLPTQGGNQEQKAKGGQEKIRGAHRSEEQLDSST